MVASSLCPELASPRLISFERSCERGVGGMVGDINQRVEGVRSKFLKAPRS
jgi:hypothetical protein